MNGQMRFDNLMNITIEQPEKITHRTTMVDPCYYCLCNSCIGNVESLTVKPQEISDKTKICFRCDECSAYCGKDKGKKYLEKIECAEYQIDDYHAEKNRKKFKICKISRGE